MTNNTNDDYTEVVNSRFIKRLKEALGDDANIDKINIDIVSLSEIANMNGNEGDDSDDRDDGGLDINALTQQQKILLADNSKNAYRYASELLLQNGYVYNDDNFWVKYTSSSIKHSVWLKCEKNIISMSCYYTIIVDIEVIKAICLPKYILELESSILSIIDNDNRTSTTMENDNALDAEIPIDDVNQMSAVLEYIKAYFDYVIIPFNNNITSINSVYTAYTRCNRVDIWSGANWQHFYMGYFYLLNGQDEVSLEHFSLQRSLINEILKSEAEAESSHGNNIHFDILRDNNKRRLRLCEILVKSLECKLNKNQ